MHSGEEGESKRKKQMCWGERRLLRSKSSRAFFYLFTFLLKDQAPLSVSCLVYF